MRLTVFFLLLPATVLAQPQPSPLLRSMNATAQAQLTKREAAIAAIHTKSQAEARQRNVRAKILELIGGLPTSRGPLHARVTGRLTNAIYSLEKVIFESLPHYYVTANLYLPAGGGAGKRPAVLLSAGHSQAGKTENHRIAASLASKGFVTLTYDPLGLGERKQTFDARIGRSIAGCCANEHLQAGALLRPPPADAGPHPHTTGTSGDAAPNTLSSGLSPRSCAVVSGPGSINPPDSG